MIKNMTLNLNKLNNAKTLDVNCGDQTFQIVNFIPYSKKEEFALQLANMALSQDKETALVFESHTMEIILAYLIMQHYSNVDVAAIETQEDMGMLYDLIVSYGNMETIMDFLNDDLGAVIGMYERIKEAVTATTEAKESLGFKVKTSFASLLTGEDFTESLAKSEALNSQMIDLLKPLMESKKVDAETGGNTLEFKRRKK